MVHHDQLVEVGHDAHMDDLGGISRLMFLFSPVLSHCAVYLSFGDVMIVYKSIHRGQYDMNSSVTRYFVEKECMVVFQLLLQHI